MGFGLFSWLNLLVAASCLVNLSGADDIKGKVRLTIINELNTDVSVYFEGETERFLQGIVTSKGGEMRVDTDPGHLFTYDFEGERHFFEAAREVTGENSEKENPETEDPKTEDSIFEVVILNAGKDEVDVFCTTTIRGGEINSVPLRFILRPSWAPRAVSRFMQLVRRGYYDGVAINRVVPGFLTQFGIGKNVMQRHEYSEFNIKDDKDKGIKFQPGMMSFAGRDVDSRTTEVFIVMPDTSQAQLDYFGVNSWETPFGYVTGTLHDTALNFFAPTGDLPPLGDGPDPHKIYLNDGYEYLAAEFPGLDYINYCFLPWEREKTEEL